MIKQYIFRLLIFTFFLHIPTWATTSPYVIISLEDIIIPINLEKVTPLPIDITPPAAPTVTTTVPTTTYEEEVYIEIYGERGSTIYVNDQKVGIIGENGTTIISLDTSGEEGMKIFNIQLKDDANNTSQTLSLNITKVNDPKFDIVYKGLTLYEKPLESTDYQLTAITDELFNSYPFSKKLIVANTLLSTLFFGYPQNTLIEKINSGTFISDIQNGFKEDKTDKAWLEEYILDEEKFYQSQWNQEQVINILSRFYVMKDLDSYYLQNWIAYILTQTIMFSPAYELDTTHTSDIANVYNRIVHFIQDESGIRYLTYAHMMSEENWRRFRSPEDNGREMLEIFLYDQKDEHVPIAAQALQNWKLNRDGDTLEVGLNENTIPLSLFNTTIINGDDFYRELVKSNTFIEGISQRLVDFFFPEFSNEEKLAITNKIVASNPERWQDILLQIIFSETYLLHNSRIKSAEETFLSLAKKVDFKHNMWTFNMFKNYLENMHQASMKYKLGRVERVPSDTLSLAYYHKLIREEIFARISYKDAIDDYTSWARQGWSYQFVSIDNFLFDSNDQLATLHRFIQYLFQTIVFRDPTQEELDFFTKHMTYEEDNNLYFHWAYNMFTTYEDKEEEAEARENRRINIAIVILDYLSRLDLTYLQKKVD